MLLGRWGSKTVCTGVLFHYWWGFCAAHCAPFDFTWFGVQNKGDQAPMMKYFREITNIISHPQSYAFEHDIAVYKFGREIHPVPPPAMFGILPQFSPNDSENATLYATGWCRQTSCRSLKRATMYRLESDDCEQLLNLNNISNVKDKTCIREAQFRNMWFDYAGPIAYEDHGFEAIAILGVVSFHDEIDIKGVGKVAVAVVTKVYEHIDWLFEMVDQN